MPTDHSTPFFFEADAALVPPSPLRTPALFDDIRGSLGTSDMSLEEMVSEMRRVRESSDYEGNHESRA